MTVYLFCERVLVAEEFEKLTTFGKVFFVLVRGSKPDGSDIFNCGLFNPRGVDKLCGRIFQYLCHVL